MRSQLKKKKEETIKNQVEPKFDLKSKLSGWAQQQNGEEEETISELEEQTEITQPEHRENKQMEP